MATLKLIAATAIAISMVTLVQADADLQMDKMLETTDQTSKPYERRLH